MAGCVSPPPVEYQDIPSPLSLAQQEAQRAALQDQQNTTPQAASARSNDTTNTTAQDASAKTSSSTNPHNPNNTNAIQGAATATLEQEGVLAQDQQRVADSAPLQKFLLQAQTKVRNYEFYHRHSKYNMMDIISDGALAKIEMRENYIREDFQFNTLWVNLSSRQVYAFCEFRTEQDNSAVCDRYDDESEKLSFNELNEILFPMQTLEKYADMTILSESDPKYVDGEDVIEVLLANGKTLLLDSYSSLPLKIDDEPMLQDFRVNSQPNNFFENTPLE